MSYGIELINNNGRVVISSSQKSATFKEKITRSVAYDPSRNNPDDHTITISTSMTDSAKRPIVYYVPNQNYGAATRGYAPISLVYSGGIWKVKVAISKDSGYTHQIILYIFEENSTATSDWGIQTFNADGSLAFDSGVKPLIVQGLVTLTRSADTFYTYSGGSYWDLGNGTANLPAAAQVSSLAIACPAWFVGAYEALDPGDGITDYNYGLCGVKRISDTQIGTFQELSWGTEFITTSIPDFPIGGPLWSQFVIAVIDGSLYD